MAKEEENPKFPAFPYKPYPIQIDFMNALYSSLDKGGISMLESPTGTGKTLSIICSALQWLVDQKQKCKSEKVSSYQDGSFQPGIDDEPDWMRNFTVENERKSGEKKIKSKKFGLASGGNEKRRNGGNCKGKSSKGVEVAAYSTMKKCQHTLKETDGLDLSDDEFLLEEYQSEVEIDGESGKPKRKVGGPPLSSSSEGESEADESGSEAEEHLKIFFCSRTHSQLSQFVKELRKTIFADEIKVVCLGSRKNLCINEEVLKLGNSVRLNERCLELQKNKKNEVSKSKSLDTGGKIRRTKAFSGCPFLRKSKLQKQFRRQLSEEEALDIEDLVHLGESIGTCPYYGSRSMVPVADLVVLPYQSLLSKSSRESLGLNLKNSVVIIDEAHNLADSLISMYDAKITLGQLEKVHGNLESYLDRFFNLLGHGNRRYIQTLLVITRALIRMLNEDDVEKKEPPVENTSQAASITINDFLFLANIDNINFVKLLNYIKESNIIHKVSGYGTKLIAAQTSLAFGENEAFTEEGSTLSNFRALTDILSSLTNRNGDGRIIISKSKPVVSGQQGANLKFVMLTGEKIFSEISDQARAIVLAGGTLQPVEETRERLFPWLLPDQLQFYSCSHIVPPESILPIAVSRGPTGHSFDFSYGSRGLSTMVHELGILLCNLVSVVPEGIIVFFSSFDYEGQVHQAWKTSGILDRIEKKKRVFREPRKSTDVELVLKEYKETIELSSFMNPRGTTSQNGAVLLAIVGGKVSEGINFNDGMGRCIVMVGLPFPNPSDIELMERVKYIEGLGESNSSQMPNFSLSDAQCCGNAQAGLGILRNCGRRGKEYYENLCMKAVNQSIGRAIRHKNDYAAMLLVDKRYASDPSKRSLHHPAEKLPKWIKDRLVPSTSNYGEVHKLLHQFFKFNKNRGCQEP